MSSVLGEFRPEQCVSLERRFVAAPLKLLVSVHIVPSLVGSGNAQTHLPCDALVKVDGNLSRCTITRLHLNTDHRHCCLLCCMCPPDGHGLFNMFEGVSPCIALLVDETSTHVIVRWVTTDSCDFSGNDEIRSDASWSDRRDTEIG